MYLKIKFNIDSENFLSKHVLLPQKSNFVQKKTIKEIDA